MPGSNSMPATAASPSKQRNEDRLSDFGRRLMQAEDRRFTLRNLKLMAVMAAGMVTFFAVLDHFAYPEFVALFAALRWTCASIVMILLLLVRSRLGKRYYKAFTVALPLVPAFFVAITIFVTQDPASVYYAALSLCIVAIGFLFHWTYKEAFTVSGLVLLFYLIACSPAIVNGLNARTGAGLFNNLVFLVATGVVVVAGSLAHHRIRVEEFRGRERLRQQKIALRENARELQRTLDELRETEGQLIQSGKMASLGQLSAGVIHEIGNPLNHSNQALFLLRRRLRSLPEDETVREAIDDIQDSIDRMKEIVRDLREFSHKRSEEFADFPVVESVEIALRLLGKEIENTETRVELRIDPSLRVTGVKNRLGQVFVNLIHNALQAMGRSTGERKNHIEVSGEVSGPFAVITVRDNGPGIPDSIRSRIFDPFFTTKEAGEGTGLGLSICFRILEALRATIQVDSDGRSFTEFRVYVPLAVSPAICRETPSGKVSHHGAAIDAGAVPAAAPVSSLHEEAVH